MTITLALILFGSLLIYAGYHDLSVRALLRGDNATKKASGSFDNPGGSFGGGGEFPKR